MTENIIAHECILFFSSVISIQNGYGLLFPAGCWVEVAELAAPAYATVSLRESKTFHQESGWVMF